MEEVRKQGDQMKEEDKEYKLSDLDTRKNETVKEWKNVDYNDLEHMAFRMELTYSETEKILDTKYIPTTTGYVLPPGV